MKTVSHTTASQAEDAAIAPSSVKVCMHVLGIARTDPRVMREATALVEAGFAVSIVDIESEGTRPAKEVIRGVNLKHIFVSSSFISTRFKRLAFIKAVQVFMRGTLSLLQTSADIYHAHDITALPACYVAARLRGKRVIFDAHELPLTELAGAHRRGLRVLLTRPLSYMLSSCTAGIAASPFYEQDLHSHYHLQKVALIRNVPPYWALTKSDRLRQHLGLNPQVRIALYQGNIQQGRGLDTLARAAAFLDRDIVIVMMGKGVEPTLSQLKALIAGEGVADRVKIIPPVPYEELLERTASADIGLTIIPLDYTLNKRMCLPNKFFEYLMAGLPVLASELDAVAEIIRTHDVGQIVSSLAPADVGAAINAMLADPGALASMQRNALAAAQREFFWEKESKRLISLYREFDASTRRLEVLG
jgi:glycosyltransferase involved in cell wall biosynthesis